MEYFPDRMATPKAQFSFGWDFSPRLLSAGIDEVPHAYKDIEGVMAAQADLVETLGRFDPRLVKMAPEGERPED